MAHFLNPDIMTIVHVWTLLTLIWISVDRYERAIGIYGVISRTRPTMISKGLIDLRSIPDYRAHYWSGLYLRSLILLIHRREGRGQGPMMDIYAIRAVGIVLLVHFPGVYIHYY